MYTRIGPYQPLKKIATGGMADVILANTPSSPSKLFAIKVLLDKFDSDSRVYQNFIDEAAILTAIDDVNIVKTYAYGDDFVRPYFVMEYIHGLSGSELMFEAKKRTTMVPLGLSLGIIRTIALALDKSYNSLTPEGTPRQIIHNDVSPHNFQIGFDGVIKLLDYGVAIEKHETSSDSRRGKFAYMSPEAINKGQLDNRSDLFSLGVSFYEMVVHRRAFKAKTSEETMQRVLNHDLKLPSDLSPTFPEELEAIILKGLAHHPNDRYQTGRAFADAIEEFAHSKHIDLTQSAQQKRLHKMFSSLIEERNAELEKATHQRLETETKEGGQQAVVPPHSERSAVEVVYLELPTKALKMISMGIVLVGLLTMLICL
ncbi:MAG: serine/threonine protein kinase [Bradymonadia bacterium]